MIPILVLLSCGRDVNETDIKMVGVGYSPDEIGPEPEPFGGYIEYDYINFAGGGLSLATLGFQSYDEIGPGLNSFKPPYATVYGLAFVFDEEVPAPDAHHGNIGVPPAVDDSCWTNFEPFSYLMASPVEMGTEIRFSSDDGATSFALGRIPEIYPPDPQDIFVYYSQVEAVHATPTEHYVDSDDGWVSEVIRPANWKHGETMTLSFPGGIPPLEAPVSSIPLPSSSVAEPQQVTLPSAISNLNLSWSGPVYNTAGQATDEAGSVISGAYSACVQYLGTAVESDAFDAASCAELPTVAKDQEELPGQIYTGPWDTPDGVTFRWDPGEAEGETVTLNVRFLGPVDRTDEGFLVPRVEVDATADVLDFWNDDVEDEKVIGEVDEPPQGYRAPQACEVEGEDYSYVFDPSLEDAYGETRISLQGDPSYNLAEVSCRLADDGEFVLTSEHLDRALAYASAKGAEGAIFYFSRSTDLDAEFPLVKDQAEMQRDIGAVKVRTHTVEIGRFWVEGPEDFQGSN